MFSGSNAEVALNAPVRALDAVQADTKETRFLVGTCHTEGSSGYHESNQLHLLGFRSEANRLGRDAILEHPTGPVSEIRSSPSDPTTLLTLSERSSKATLWKIPPELLESRQTNEYADEDDEDPEDAPLEGNLEQRATLTTPSEVGGGGGEHA